MSENNNTRYVIAERSSTEQHMVNIFDRHFRPALREFSRDSLIAFIHGMQEVPELDRSRFRQEILSFLQRITRSADAVLNSSPEEGQPNRTTSINEE